ncbi:MAG: hypothetical protein C4576_20390 [Desulfobacteraceae bacterium]|nr:MAG: hypothetical protein C4576_20390 [Desulfobacteraceae bacterium]
MVDIVTDFAFKDDRSYLHSTTMCEFIGLKVLPALGMNSPAILLDARFHRIAAKNGIIRCLEKQAKPGVYPGLAAEFKLSSGSSVHYAYFLENESPVRERVQSNYQIEDLKLATPFGGSCRTMITDLRSLLENTIEANKRFHQATLPQKGIKVVNLFMKRFPLYPIFSRKGWYTLNIRHIGSRRHDNGIATINLLSFAEEDIPAFEMCYFLPGVSA